MNFNLVKFVVASCFLFFNSIFVFSQTTTTHIVDKGETLATIAQKYNTTEAKLLELNPDASQFVYVGMELVIPSISRQYNDEEETAKNGEIPNNQTSEILYSKNFSEEKMSEFGIIAGLSINNFTGKDVDNVDIALGFHVGFLARYYFDRNIFVEGSIGLSTKGYKSEEYVSSGDYWLDDEANYDGYTSTKYLSYNIDIPFLIGYKLLLNRNMDLKIKIGPYFTYAISGSESKSGYMTIYPDVHSSETEHFDDKVDISDMYKFKHFGYGLHAGIGIGYKNFDISLSYQHGFSKVFNDSNAYEQNFLITLGYKF